MADSNREQRLQDILVAYLEAVETGHGPTRDEWLAEFSEFAAELEEFLRGREKMEQVAQLLKETAKAPTSPHEVPTFGPQNATPTDAGTKIRYFGDYELTEEIARGGMGVVYKALQVKLKRTVAIKMILSGELANSNEVERFYTEARAAANLHHANIVAIHEVGQHQGQHYFSMDYIEGESLAEKITRGPLAARAAAELMVKVAKAVCFAHVEGVIHRDLKPANILLDGHGEPHVTDFGLAKQVHSPDGVTRESLTATGQVLGTPSYMPPEQAGGETKKIGPRSDVYSLGAVLYCCLTGCPPFQAASPLDTLLQVLDREPVSPRTLNSAVPRDLETICLKCLEKDPARRYATAQELADELKRFLDGKPIKARPIGASGRAWRWCRRNPVVSGLSAALVVALLTGTVISTIFGAQARHEADVSAGLTVKAKDLAAKWQKEADRATKEGELRRGYLYSAHMNLANEAWKTGNIPRVNELLNLHRPKAKQEDLRSFDWGYLWRECNRQRKTVTVSAHGEQAVEFSISPGGRWIAVGIWGSITSDRAVALREIKLWDMRTGTLRKTIAPKGASRWAPDKICQRLVFSADNKLFATVVSDRKLQAGSAEFTRPRIQIWDLETMKPRATIELEHFELGDRIALSPDGKLVAAACASKPKDAKKQSHRVLIWDVPKEGTIAVGQEKSNRECGTSRGMYSFAFTADGKYLTWRKHEFDQELMLTDVSGAGKDIAFPVRGKGLSRSPDGKYLAACPKVLNKVTGASGYREAKFFDAKTGKEIHAFPLPPSRLGRFVRHPRVLFSPDSRTLAVIWKSALNLWDVETKERIGDIRSHTDNIEAVAFGADGKIVTTVAKNKATGLYEAKVWDVNTRPGPEELSLGKGLLRNLVGLKLNYNGIKGLGIAPDGKTLAVAWSTFTESHNGVVALYDLTPGSFGKLIGEPAWHSQKDTLRNGVVPEWMSFSPDGKRMAISGIDIRDEGCIQLWSLAHGPTGVKTTLEHTIFAPQQLARRRTPLAVLSPDGTKLAYHARPLSPSNLEPDRVYVYDIASGKTLRFPKNPKSWFAYQAGLQGHFPDWRGTCHGILFSSDGKRIFSAHNRNFPNGKSVVVAWDATTGDALSVLESPALNLERMTQALSPSPDGKALAACYDDHSVLVWDVSEGTLREVRDELKRRAENKDKEHAQPAAKPTVILRGHSDYITAVTFHPDGKILATASNDRTIKLWDVATGEVRLTLEGHTANITSLAFTPDGNTLISGDRSGTVKFWRAVRL